MVCSVHVAYDAFKIVSVHNVRDSGVVSVEVLDSQLLKHWTLCPLCITEWIAGLYRAVYFAEIRIKRAPTQKKLKLVKRP